MLVKFNAKQLEKLSDLCMDLAKGAFLAGFTLQIVENIDILILLKYISGGIMLTSFALYLVRQKD